MNRFIFDSKYLDKSYKLEPPYNKKFIRAICEYGIYGEYCNKNPTIKQAIVFYTDDLDEWAQRSMFTYTRFLDKYYPTRKKQKDYNDPDYDPYFDELMYSELAYGPDPADFDIVEESPEDDKWEDFY